ncbi:MAG: hypothetical protein ACLR9W_01720 [Enterobacter hormaechei]
MIALKMLHALEVPFLLVGASGTSPGFDTTCGHHLPDWLPVCQTVGGDLPSAFAKYV